MSQTEDTVAAALQSVALLAEMARQAAPEWIPAETQEDPECDWVYNGPRDEREVLVFLNGHSALTDYESRKGGGYGIRLGYFDFEKGYWRVHGQREQFVTHWMERPAPPPTGTVGPESEG